MINEVLIEIVLNFIKEFTGDDNDDNSDSDGSMLDADEYS